jgi:hypothetical protein
MMLVATTAAFAVLGIDPQEALTEDETEGADEAADALKTLGKLGTAVRFRIPQLRQIPQCGCCAICDGRQLAKSWYYGANAGNTPTTEFPLRLRTTMTAFRLPV